MHFSTLDPCNPATEESALRVACVLVCAATFFLPCGKQEQTVSTARLVVL